MVRISFLALVLGLQAHASDVWSIWQSPDFDSWDSPPHPSCRRAEPPARWTCLGSVKRQAIKVDYIGDQGHLFGVLLAPLKAKLELIHFG